VQLTPIFFPLYRYNRCFHQRKWETVVRLRLSAAGNTGSTFQGAGDRAVSSGLSLDYSTSTAGKTSVMDYSRKVIFFFLFLSFFSLSFLPSAYAEKDITSVLKPDYGIISGEWQRTDGSYLIKADNVQPDGRVTVEYFNPRPIHVAEAAISRQKGLIKLFIKFQDKGYEGSTYTLYYYAGKDALAGFYYQAAMDRTYQVIFMRKSKAD